MMEGNFSDKDQTATPTEFRTTVMDVDQSPPLENPHDQLGETRFTELLAGKPNKISFIDKSLLVEEFFNGMNRVQVTAPRRFGKTTNLGMLKHFSEFQFETDLTEEEFQSKLKETSNYKLFSKYGLKIMNQKDIVKNHFGRYPVICISFKCENFIDSYEKAMKHCGAAIQKAFVYHSYLKSSPKLLSCEIRRCEKWCHDDVETFTPEFIVPGIKDLAKYLYKHFNRKVLLLVDEYDSVITQSMISESITERDLKKIVQDTMAIIKTAVKLNCDERGVQYAFITGISCICLSGMSLSGSNVIAHKFLHYHPFVKFYGLTDEETTHLLTETYRLSEDKVQVARARYNGYESLDGTKIYSTWSLLTFARNPDHTENVWKDTAMVIGLEQAFKIPKVRELIETTLLSGLNLYVTPNSIMTIDDILNLFRLLKSNPSSIDIPDPSIFLNFLQEQGYLTFAEKQKYKLKIPNEEIKGEYFKKITDYIVQVGGIDRKLLDELKIFFRQISNGYVKEHFIVFRRNLEKLVRYDEFSWLTRDEANLGFVVNLITYDLGFKRGNQEKATFVDYAMMADNCAFVFGLKSLKYGQTSSEKVLEFLLERHYDALDTDDIKHYVLMGINMNKDAKISISYLYNNRDIKNMETI